MKRYCQKCNSLISDQYDTCYQCGAEYEKSNKRFFIIGMGILLIFTIKGADIYYVMYFKPNFDLVFGVVGGYLIGITKTFFAPTTNIFLIRMRMIFIATFVAIFGWFGVQIFLKWMKED